MPEHASLTAALVEFQKNIPHVVKGNTAEVPTKSGGKFKYDYADLTDVTEILLPLLADQGLAWTAGPTMSEYGFALHYELRHTSGESIEGYYPLPQAAPQEIGSAVTYARRYALCAVTGVAPGGDDDDAQATNAAPANVPARRAPAISTADVNAALTAISTAQSADGLRAVWERLGAAVKQHPDVIAAKDSAKGLFS